MTWLNWSLKLHIRLRTISFWYPHISHMSMFKECHIHLCDCTWLNVFHILNFCWLNTKRFLSVLIIFGKSFVFAKISKISKTVLPCFGYLVAGQSSHIPPVAILHKRFLWLTGGSKSQSRKRFRNFSKFWVFKCLATWFGDLFASASSSREVVQKILRLLLRLTCEWTF